jgi:hypothetical protein
LPHDDAVEWRAGRGPRRWSWYTPVTVVIALATVVASLVLAAAPFGASKADTLEPVTDPSELRATGDRALGLVAYPWHDLGYEIVFAPGQPKVRAQTDLVAHRITVFLGEGDATHRIAHDIGHELGHAYDAKYLTDADRLRYLQQRGVPSATWFPGTKFSDYDTGAGDFAEVFAACHAASPEFRSRLADKPAQACSLIPAPHAS